MFNEAGRTVWSRIGRMAFILALLIFVALPIVWLALGSLKSREAALALPPELIFQPDFSAYAKIMSQGFLGSFKNSLAIALTNMGTAAPSGVAAKIIRRSFRQACLTTQSMR